MEKKANYSYFITAVKSLTYIAPFCLTNTPISSQILCNNDMNVGWQNKMEIERSVGFTFSCPVNDQRQERDFFLFIKQILSPIWQIRVRSPELKIQVSRSALAMERTLRSVVIIGG